MNAKKNRVQSLVPAIVCTGLLALALTGCSNIPFVDKLPFIGKKKEAASIEANKVPKKVLIHTKLGLAYLQQGDLEKAQDKLTKAIALKADYTEAHHYLAETYRQQGNAEMANKEYKQALQSAPDNASLHNNYGVFLCGTSRYTEAEEHFLIATNNPTYAAIGRAFENAGLCLLKLNDRDRAEFYFQQALQHNPKLPKALYQLAAIGLAKNRTEVAKDYLKRYEDLAEHSSKTLWLAVQINKSLDDLTAVATYSRLLIEGFKDSDEYQKLTGLDTIQHQDSSDVAFADNAVASDTADEGFSDAFLEDSGFADSPTSDSKDAKDTASKATAPSEEDSETSKATKALLDDIPSVNDASPTTQDASIDDLDSVAVDPATGLADLTGDGSALDNSQDLPVLLDEPTLGDNNSAIGSTEGFDIPGVRGNNDPNDSRALMNVAP